jgi:hypothetical protein
MYMTPLIGVVCFAIIIASWFGGVRYFKGIPAGLMAIAVGMLVAWGSTLLGFGYGGMSVEKLGELFIREKLQEVFVQTGTTMMLVSYDLEEAVYLDDQVLLLTKRPTRIAEILQYPDPRPRTVATLSEASFIGTKKRSLEIFQREVRR